jgi:hypothetical protein
MPADKKTSSQSEPNSADVVFDLDRWTELLATGEVGWPDHLTESDASQLLIEVRRRRRRRLVRVIAHLIAADISRDRRRDKQNV